MLTGLATRAHDSGRHCGLPNPTDSPRMTHPNDPPGANGFDFFHGRWQVAHRRLAQRLAGSSEWEEFGGTCQVQPLLGGLGNVDDNTIELPQGHYRAVTLRTYDAATGSWTIWWLDGRNPAALDAPMTGRFKDGIGTFHGTDTWEGQPIRIRFRWTMPRPGAPRWEQAFSADGDASWETNWVMDFTRQPAPGL